MGFNTPSILRPLPFTFSTVPPFYLFPLYLLTHLFTTFSLVFQDLLGIRYSPFLFFNQGEIKILNFSTKSNDLYQYLSYEKETVTIYKQQNCSESSYFPFTPLQSLMLLSNEAEARSRVSGENLTSLTNC